MNTWQSFALCRGSMANGVSLWFPERNKHRALEAKNICERCPVQERCREAGKREPIGVWGGVNVSVHVSRQR